MDPSQFYINYHVSSMQGPSPSSYDHSNFEPTQPIWPSIDNGTIANASTTPARYPMPVRHDDIINTTDTNAPAVVYSGVEPLMSLTRPELDHHFQDTTYPRTSSMIPGSQGRTKPVFVTPTTVQGEQRALLRQMSSSMQNYKAAAYRDSSIGAGVITPVVRAEFGPRWK